MDIQAANEHGSRECRKTRAVVRACAVMLFVVMRWASEARAVTPESPEVRKLINSALGYLDKNGESRLGGKCLIGLTFLKANRPDHPRVREALEACRAQIKADQAVSLLDVYSNGLAVIFLCELSPETHAAEIEWYLGRMRDRQKPHGGWGYQEMQTGDTSQTQYAALSYWEAHQRGFNVEPASVEKLADWLLRTQGPDGCWGYQGQLSTTGQPVPQTETNCSMLAAGLGCIYICADLFGADVTAASSNSKTGEASSIPSALRRVESPEARSVKKIRPQQVNVAQLFAAMKQAHAWMNENYQIDIGPKRYYYLYGLERYRSFQELAERTIDPEPSWYNDGYRFLAKDQAEEGSWRGGYCGAECDTAFATLFLLRSTQKALRARPSEGTLLAGRGLPTNLSRAKLRNGQLIVEQVHTKIGELLTMIDEGDDGLLDELARDPAQLVVEEVDSQSARRLQQLVRGGEPEVRLLAVRALGRSGNFDYVPSLLYALTDPDPRIVLEARDGLRFISRKFDGFGPPDDFTEQQRYEAVDAWKKWYQSLRPTAVLEP
ncbi:MAG: HEAT repeat domain-containing protein [Pirellulales bacterium]